MITNCQSNYFEMKDGKLVCHVCGEPAEKHKVETKEKRGIRYPKESKRRK